MYENIGKKIKGLAKACCIVETIAAILAGVIMIATGIETDMFYYIVGGAMIAILGPLVAWVSSWLLYGYGELIDKACEIEANTREK